MDLKELKKQVEQVEQVEQITKELKSKASGDTAVLVDSLSFIFSIMLETSAGILAQNDQNHPQVTVIRSQIRQEVLESQQAESLVARMVTVERT